MAGDRAGVWIRVCVIATHRDARRRPPTPVGLPRHVTSHPHTAQPARRAGAIARAVVWRTVRCRGAGCGTVFSLCGSYYRGQAYFGDHCRATAQRHQRRQANARHQRSEEGRLDHRDRQRAYRARCRLRRVTDTPSTRPPRSTTIASPVGHAPIRPVCRVCGRAVHAAHDDEVVPRPHRAVRPVCISG